VFQEILIIFNNKSIIISFSDTRYYGLLAEGKDVIFGGADAREKFADGFLTIACVAESKPPVYRRTSGCSTGHLTDLTTERISSQKLVLIGVLILTSTQ